MARLTAAERRALPDSAFAGPGRTFPIQDKDHAIAAEGLVGKKGPSVKKAVRAAIKKKYGIG